MYVVVRSQNKLILAFYFFPFGVIWDTCWPDLNAFQRCYLKEHYVIVFNSQCSLLPMKNMVPFNGADRSISQGYAWAFRGTTIKVGKMLLQTISNMYLSVESLAMIKGPVNSFLQERKVFLQRHQISPCHDKLPAPLAKRLREGRGCFGPWKCTKEQQHKKLLTCFGTCSEVQALCFLFVFKQHLSHLFSLNLWLDLQSVAHSSSAGRNLCTCLPHILTTGH